MISVEPFYFRFPRAPGVSTERKKRDPYDPSTWGAGCSRGFNFEALGTYTRSQESIDASKKRAAERKR
jgi:hypothetical protein